MIEISGLKKSFDGTEVLKNIDLIIQEGEIFGLIGKSGTGKSTLLRCINLLEQYQEGKLLVDGMDLSTLKGKDIRIYRKNIGMVFQHFSLLNRRTVYENIAIPLKCWGMSKKDIDTRVKELVKLVHIEEKLYEKPSNLSGGQKQRVAIARALALEPKILLCDEATSALDPKTTSTILDLLSEINERLHITIVIVSHQMEVIRKICHRVALMNEGYIVEVGDVDRIFLNDTENLMRFLGEEEMELPEENRNIQILFREGEFSLLTEIICQMNGKITIVSSSIERFRNKKILKSVMNIPEEEYLQMRTCLEEKNIEWKEI